GTTITAFAYAHGHEPVPTLGPRFPAALDAVFGRVLAKEAADRYADALSFAAAFRQAAGIGTEVPSLPALEPSVRDAAINAAPQPIAEAISAFEAARNINAARDALVIVARTLVRYVGLLALACRSRVAGDDDSAAAMRALTRGTLSDAEWIGLARTLTRPWLDRRDAY